MQTREIQELINYYRRSKNIKYMSQKGQDKWVIEEIFQGKRSGFFVDLAASDGVTLSNTYILEKHFGWTGICIEPNPEFYTKLQNNRNSICVNDCIDFQEGMVEFRFDNMELGGIIGSDTDNCMKYREKQILEAREKNQTTFLKTKTLEQVLLESNAPKIIDYLSLDVEGAETRILTGFPFDKYIFLSMTIERPTPLINQVIFSNGYVFVQNSKVMGYDSFYVHKSIPNFELIKKEDFVQIPPKDW
jgi:FkbM family methyltransferase